MKMRPVMKLAPVAVALAGCSAGLAPDTQIAPPPPEVTMVTPPAHDPSELQVLFWNAEQRSARFRAMEQWFAGLEVSPAVNPRELPDGTPLSETDAQAIEQLMAETNAVGVMVLQNGQKRFEAYRDGFGPDQRWTSFSVAKSFTSTLLGAALHDGFIGSLDDTVPVYVPELAGSAYHDVTIRQLAQMTSGVAWNEDYTDPASDVAQMNRFVLEHGPNAIVAQMGALKREATPGTKWVYKTGETNLLGLVVENAVGLPLAEYAQGRIVRQAGFAGGLFWMVDPRGGNIGGCCLSLTLGDYARLGQFVLEGGKGSVPDGWFTEAATPAPPMAGATPVSYGYQWWIYPEINAFGAQGIFGQGIMILPQRQLVVAMLGNWSTASNPTIRQKWRSVVAKIDTTP